MSSPIEIGQTDSAFIADGSCSGSVLKVNPDTSGISWHALPGPVFSSPYTTTIYNTQDSEKEELERQLEEARAENRQLKKRIKRFKLGILRYGFTFKQICKVGKEVKRNRKVL